MGGCDMDKFDIACDVLRQAASEASDYAEDGDRSDREVLLEALRDWSNCASVCCFLFEWVCVALGALASCALAFLVVWLFLYYGVL